MDLFILKKIIGLLLMPMSIVIILLIFSLLTFKKHEAKSFKSLLLATLILVVSSIPWVSDHLMLPHENDYPAFTKQNQLDYIVILGCGHTTDKTWPATSQLKPCSLQRMVEGLRIYHLHPEAQIITSGSAFNNEESNAIKVKQALTSLGVPERKIFVESFPKDTEEEAQLIAPRVSGKKVALVTNADHMPRSVAYFKREGANVIAAPASPWVKGINNNKDWGYYVPTVQELQQTTNAWYETLGQIIQWVKSF